MILQKPTLSGAQGRRALLANGCHAVRSVDSAAPKAPQGNTDIFLQYSFSWPNSLNMSAFHHLSIRFALFTIRPPDPGGLI